METYKVVRFYCDGPSEVVQSGLTLEQAQAHCRDPETRGVDPVKGPWFDGYDEERDQ